MQESVIKLCGREVKAGYCYATEIAFYNFAGVGVDKFDAENPQHVVYLIMAAIFAYYNAKEHEGESHDLTDEDILYASDPSEIVDAFKTVVNLRQRWYGVDAADAAAQQRPTERKDEDDGKN